MSDRPLPQVAVSPALASWAFFVLVLALSIPLLLLGTAGGRLPIASFLPLSALLIVYRQRGLLGATTWLGRLRWVLLALSIMPLAWAHLRRWARRPLDSLALPEHAGVAGADRGSSTLARFRFSSPRD